MTADGEPGRHETWAVGAAWLSGTLLMLAGGVLLHLLVRALRRPSGGPGSLTPRP